MKKSYTKPVLLAENFSLSQDISSECEGVSHQAILSCPITIEDLNWVVYTTEIAGCLMTGVGEDVICYHNPTDAFNVFGS